MAIATKPKPKQTTSHKKRQGTHQKRNTHFAKAYWPYLPIGLVVGLGMFFNNVILQNGVLQYAINMTPPGLLSSTNVERQNNNLPGLTLNDTLSQAAQQKAKDMVDKNYWAHTTPEGHEPWVFINNVNYSYEAAGENLAYGFADNSGAVQGWMNSPGHRANILNGVYSEVGFGIAHSPNYQGNGEQTIVVAMYAKPARSNIASQPSAATTPSNASNVSASGQPISVNSQAGTMQVSAVVPGETKVSRVQMASSGGNVSWSVYAISLIGFMLIVVFIMRHSLAWHKVLIKGEKFILKHKVLDVVIVSGIMIGFILTRTAGVIQ